jgi:hypothetical protein
MDDNNVITTDHAIIKQWVEENDGKPALVGSLAEPEEIVGLRIEFPGETQENLLSDNEPNPEVSWDDFFRIFEDKLMAFMYNPKKRGQDKTDAYRFIPRATLNTAV